MMGAAGAEKTEAATLAPSARGQQARSESETAVYVRVTPYTFDPAKEQEQSRISEQRLIPALQQLPGFLRFTGGIDRAAGRGIAITESDDMAHAAGLRDAIIGVVQEMAEQGLRLDTAQIYEVNAST